MVGLTFVDILRLTPLQWSALISNALAWSYGYVHPKTMLKIASLTLPLLIYAFYNVPMSIDIELLYRGAQSAQTHTWTEFLDTLHKHAYINYQPPHLTYFIAQTPALGVQQLLWMPIALGSIALLFTLYGHAAALLCATPLFALTIHQPSHDLLLFTALLITLRLIQLEHRVFAAVSYGVTWWIKPLTLLTLPYFLWHLRGYLAVSLIIWAMYVGWSGAYQFGVLQWQFLMQQLFIYAILHKRVPAAITHGTVRKTPGTLTGAMRYRWAWLTMPALAALPFYLFPAYARRWTWFGYALLGIILIGYGNIKYCLLNVLFIFPIVPNYASEEIHR